MTCSAKILVVDDEPAIRFTLNCFLTNSGFSVAECSDGVEALERVPQEKPALILLDVHMPRLDGWATLKELRQRGCRAPVLMLTNVDDVPARVKGLEAGADDYVGKPCDLIELLARIRAAIRRASLPFESPLRLKFDDLVVDLGRKSAARGKEEVRFTRTEFALLELLAQHHGRPVSRELMLQNVWGLAAENNSHTLDTCLWRLRKKLGDHGRESRCLRSLPGIGYVLQCEIERPDAENPAE